MLSGHSASHLLKHEVDLFPMESNGWMSLLAAAEYGDLDVLNKGPTLDMYISTK